jgi:outer membrane murein-binding lipoprotein Lpp
MNRRFLLAALAMIPLALSGCASTGSIDNSKIGKLASSLGLTAEQAQAGVGAMLKLSQTRLDPAQYEKIAAVVPRADEYMALAGRLGAFQGAVPSASGLAGAFGKIGISPDQAARLVPEVTDYVAKAASPEGGAIFAGSLR